MQTTEDLNLSKWNMQATSIGQSWRTSTLAGGGGLCKLRRPPRPLRETPEI
jgi:hypothetical protein